MNWEQVCADPTLQDLPYKIELNEWGQIVMTPASNRHGRLQTSIGTLLNQEKKQGVVISECSVDTTRGTKVADVAWCSDVFVAKHGESTPYQKAPELCVEVSSPSNSQRELDEKKALYFDAGAAEVWFCVEDGNLHFFNRDGQIECSHFFPDFPGHVD